MRRAKSLGGGEVVIAPDRPIGGKRLTLTTELTRAVRDDDFEVFYQPSRCARAGRPGRWSRRSSACPARST